MHAVGDSCGADMIADAFETAHEMASCDTVSADESDDEQLELLGHARTSAGNAQSSLGGRAPLKDETARHEGSDEGLSSSGEISTQLRMWAVYHSIPQKALTALLKLLRSHPCHSGLPSDARTLMRTPRSGQEIVDVPPGKYIHFGVTAGLTCALCSAHTAHKISLSFSIDGLPVSRSSRAELWPIQCLIQNERNVQPFVVGVFFGDSKPKSSNQYLKAFVDEMKVLLDEGIQVCSRTIEVDVANFICNTPARAFILMTKGHTGYGSCFKCTVHGSQSGSTTVFLDMDAPLRSSESFRMQHDDDHHHGISILTASY